MPPGSLIFLRGLIRLQTHEGFSKRMKDVHDGAGEGESFVAGLACAHPDVHLGTASRQLENEPRRLLMPADLPTIVDERDGKQSADQFADAVGRRVGRVELASLTSAAEHDLDPARGRWLDVDTGGLVARRAPSVASLNGWRPRVGPTRRVRRSAYLPARAMCGHALCLGLDPTRR